MANVTMNIRIISKNDTKTNWESINPVLLKGEIGIELGTNKQKTGDGISTWNNLPYSTVTPSEIEDFGGGDMLKSEFASNGVIGKVDHAVDADKLSTNRNISLSGDVAGTVSTNLGADASIAATLATVLTGGASSGLYKVTVNTKGLITAVASVQASDIPDLTLSKITDAGTAAALNTGINPNNVVVVESNGFISNSVISSLHVVDVEEFDTIAEMLTWSEAENGDLAIVNLTTGVEVYILRSGNPAVQSNWIRLNIPTGAVVSVNGETGAVTLTTTNVSEGTNLYYTEARATANFNTNFALKSSAGLTDGASILHSTDTLILDGGNATL